MSRRKDGFERTIGLSVVATNVHRIGLLLQRAEHQWLRKQRLKRASLGGHRAAIRPEIGE